MGAVTRPLSAARREPSRVVARTETGTGVRLSVKNGARAPFLGAGGGSTQPDSTDVRSGRLAGCDPGPSASGTAKWRSGPSKKRHLAPFFLTFLTVFRGFFCELSHQSANWRGSGPEKR